jgi:hypothetical protein
MRRTAYAQEDAHLPHPVAVLKSPWTSNAWQLGRAPALKIS